MTTTVYFDDIQNVICKELLQAKRSIYVAVAWFTDLLLFETLLKLQEKNVYIQLIIIDDEINFKNYSLPFEKLRNSSGSFLAVKNDKMHHKFCIIDEDVVITGSYNWTYKAATGNKNENIQISKGHSELTYKFIREFYRILLQNQEDKIEVIDEIPVGEIVDKLSKVHRNRSGIPYVWLDDGREEGNASVFLTAAANELYKQLDNRLSKSRHSIQVLEFTSFKDNNTKSEEMYILSLTGEVINPYEVEIAIR